MWSNFIDNLSSFAGQGSNWMFFLFALMAISGAIFMISYTKVVHMVVSLALTFISLAGLYILLEAEFVAIVQILIYAGAISILMIFGIMLTKHRDEEVEKHFTLHNILLIIGSVALLGILFYAIQTADFPDAAPFVAGEDNTAEIGKQLFTEHVIPFELMSVLLTVALIGAIVIAKREEE